MSAVMAATRLTRVKVPGRLALEVAEHGEPCGVPVLCLHGSRLRRRGQRMARPVGCGRGLIAAAAMLRLKALRGRFVGRPRMNCEALCRAMSRRARLVPVGVGQTGPAHISISAPRRVSIFISPVMTVCSSARNPSWVGVPNSRLARHRQRQHPLPYRQLPH